MITKPRLEKLFENFKGLEIRKEENKPLANATIESFKSFQDNLKQRTSCTVVLENVDTEEKVSYQLQITFGMIKFIDSMVHLANLRIIESNSHASDQVLTRESEKVLSKFVQALFSLSDEDVEDFIPIDEIYCDEHTFYVSFVPNDFCTIEFKLA